MICRNCGHHRDVHFHLSDELDMCICELPITSIKASTCNCIEYISD